LELCIFNKIEDDLCIKGILEKDNVIVLRNIIEFSETEGVTSSAIKEYVATRLANDDNILSRLAQAGKFIGDDLYRLAKFDIEQIYKKLFSTQIKYALVGIEYQKQVLIDNTKAFVSGKAANNVLLFGDRGTGKSSSVKALLNMFCDDGLRIIEMPKHCIKDIPSLSKVLAESPNKYIIFLDDLTFESHETEYRALKVAMEGQLQANPTNVLIYATSNRRHLIRENWSDREGGEIHVNDQMQETLSLSERFGISLVFSAPNQKEYLNIVSEMLKKHNIQMNADIEKEAVVWQMNYGGRSARCAKQFVTSYIAK